MKSKILIVFFLIIINGIYAQNNTATDSLKNIINKQQNDTPEVNALSCLANQQASSDSGFEYAQQVLLLARKIKYKKGEGECLWVLATCYFHRGDIIKAHSGEIKVGTKEGEESEFIILLSITV